MKRPVLPTGLKAAFLVLMAATGSWAQATGQQVRRGVIFSEIHHRTSPITGGTLTTYIELLNLDPTTAVDLSGATLALSSPGAPNLSVLTFPTGTVIPPFSRSAQTGTLVVFQPSALGPPPGPGPVIPAPTGFFQAGLLAPGAATAICLTGPAGTNLADTVALNWPVGAPIPCTNTAFTGQLGNTNGLVLRGYRVDSNTRADFFDVADPPAPPDPPYAGGPVGPSPREINPEMSRVTGIFFGSPQNLPNAPGIPFPTPPINIQNGSGSVGGLGATTFTVPVNIQQPSAVAWVEFGLHPYDAFRRQSNPQFDPVIPNGILQLQTALVGDDPFLGHETATSFPSPNPVAPGGMMWNLVVPDPLMNDGIVNIDMGPLDQVDLGFQTFNPTPANPQGLNLRIERVLTDLTTDGTASGTGNTTSVQVDILPPNEPPGDTWCELIIYDGNGFSYRAKVRNWPANPLGCSTPNFGMGSNAVGNLDLIALCFDPTSPKELYILPSMTVAIPTGSGPFLGLIPDAATLTFLGAPLGADPAHVTVTVDGLYYYTVTTPVLSGMSLDATAIEYDPSPGGGFGTYTTLQTATVLIM